MNELNDEQNKEQKIKFAEKKNTSPGSNSSMKAKKQPKSLVKDSSIKVSEYEVLQFHGSNKYPFLKNTP